MVQMLKADAPPPLGSTAVKKCCVLLVGLRTSYLMGGHVRSMKFCTSTDEKHFSEPSAEMPSDCVCVCDELFVRYDYGLRCS